MKDLSSLTTTLGDKRPQTTMAAPKPKPTTTSGGRLPGNPSTGPADGTVTTVTYGKSGRVVLPGNPGR